MIIDKISISANGYAYCKSEFYSTCDVLSPMSEYVFHSGVNKLIGDIDSGVWAISYLISMYKYRQKDFILHCTPKIIINDNEEVTLKELAKYTCYLDLSYPLFSSKKSVAGLINLGIKKYKLGYSLKEIMDLFSLTAERVNKPLRCIGNEKINAMAAVAFCHNKQIFCFPWMSRFRFDGFHRHIPDTLNVLETKNKIICLPTTEDSSLS